MCILVHISHFCEFLILNPFRPTVSCESHLQPQWRTRHFILGVQNFWGQGTNCGPRTSPSGGLGPNSPDAKTLSLSFSFLEYCDCLLRPTLENLASYSFRQSWFWSFGHCCNKNNNIYQLGLMALSFWALVVISISLCLLFLLIVAWNKSLIWLICFNRS